MRAINTFLTLTILVSCQMSTGSLMTRQTYDRAPRLTKLATAHISKGGIILSIPQPCSFRIIEIPNEITATNVQSITNIVYISTVNNEVVISHITWQWFKDRIGVRKLRVILHCRIQHCDMIMYPSHVTGFNPAYEENRQPDDTSPTGFI